MIMTNAIVDVTLTAREWANEASDVSNGVPSAIEYIADNKMSRQAGNELLANVRADSNLIFDILVGVDRIAPNVKLVSQFGKSTVALLILEWERVSQEQSHAAEWTKGVRAVTKLRALV